MEPEPLGKGDNIYSFHTLWEQAENGDLGWSLLSNKWTLAGPGLLLGVLRNGNGLTENMNAFYHISTFFKDIQTVPGIVFKNRKDKESWKNRKNSYKSDTPTEQAPQRWNTAATDWECKQMENGMAL